MERRIAFLIGNQRFLPEAKLLNLSGPENDVRALKEVLADRSLGQYEVNVLLDKSSGEILECLEESFEKADHSDLILVFLRVMDVWIHLGNCVLQRRITEL